MSAAEGPRAGGPDTGRTRPAPVDALHVFSAKAEKYARYRWDYAPAAIERLLVELQTAVSGAATYGADIGAGTGRLTTHLIGHAGRLFAIEPNAGMRAFAGQACKGRAGVLVLGGSAEQLPLAKASLDWITVGQALHWFEPQTAQAEFRRVLRPGGLLAVIENRAPTQVGASDVHVPDAAIKAIYASAPAAQQAARAARLERSKGGRPRGEQPRGERPVGERPVGEIEVFWGRAAPRRFTFPFVFNENWEQFLGGLLSASEAPLEEDPEYPLFETAAREVFERYSRDGLLEARLETVLWLGRMDV
jgi:SAM-dependent methyltransferase